MDNGYRWERRRPHANGDCRYVRGREGAYWQADDGLVVRVAAPEPERVPVTDVAFVRYVPLVALLNQSWQR